MPEVDERLERYAQVCREAWVEYISKNATNPPAKWLESFEDLSPFWKNLNRHVAACLTRAIEEELSGTSNQDSSAVTA